jgi:hypothetical protein
MDRVSNRVSNRISRIIEEEDVMEFEKPTK